MVGRVRRSHRHAGAVAALALALLAGCGSNSDNPSGVTGTASVVPADPGEDLLGSEQQSVVIEGTDLEATWRLPADYEPENDQKAVLDTEDAQYVVIIGAKPGISQKRAAAIEMKGDGGKLRTAQEQVTVDGRRFTLVRQDSAELSGWIYLHQPPKEKDTWAVLFYAAQPAADVPQERLDEALQIVGSFDLEPAPAAG